MTRRPLIGLLVGVALVCAACVAPDRSVHIDSVQAPPSAPPTTAGSPEGEPPPTSSAPVTSPPLGNYRLTAWKDCKSGFECATMRVPLDWRNPAGTRISLSVMRLPAREPGARIGSVLFNPGGPGEPGTQFLRDFKDNDRLPKDLNERFDLVSWDPRGTGGSAGVRCLTEAQLQDPDPDPTPDSAADTAALTAEATALRTGCEKNDGTELPFVGTKNTVRDLDALRGALGDSKLTYVGYRYGTTIGTVYGEMFPRNIRAMVLDGVTAVGADPAVDKHEQAKSFEKNLEAFLADCASRTGCLFGKGNPRQAFLDLVGQLEAGKRLPGTYSIPDAGGAEHQRRGTAGIGEFYPAVFVTLYGRENWIALEQMLAAAANGDGKLMLYLRDQFAGRQANGSWSHIGDANVAINCADQALRPPNPLGDPTLRVEWTKELPLVGGVFATGTPGCSGFPSALEPLPATTAELLKRMPPVVVVGSTGDPATPYQQALDFAKIAPTATVVTWESEDHTAYGRGSKCLDGPITEYLVDLTKPTSGLRCKP